MKKIVYLLSFISILGVAQAKPEITWDDPNPPATVASYIVYEKVTTNNVVSWKPIWKVIGSKVFNLPATSVTKTYTVSALSNLGVEGPKSNELTVQAPVALQNLRINPPQ
jgi:hypothetical protein